MRISKISGQNCAKIISSYPISMPKIVFEHLKEHINLISLRKNKP